MTPTIEQLSDLVASTACGELKPRFRHVAAERKADGSLLTEADLAMDRALRDALTRAWPDIDFLSEEMAPSDQAARLASGRPVWCLDPLDGTSNFAAGLPLYAVSLALLAEGRPTLGVVYDPERDECFTATLGGGAHLNGRALPTRTVRQTLQRAVGMVDFKRLPAALAERLVREPPYHSQRNLGSCALEWCWLAAGRGDFYVHGGMRLWDLAAGSLILAEAGGQARTLDGETVFRPTTTARSVVAARDTGLFETLCHTLTIPARQSA
ncbi:inositol monophosphatase family protein [Acidihalobacter prosperus]|uniref:Inositol monophosphatase n=1 Tax=Acidihalobacter prosperus TaxID=160660 RepID=A0A1A6C6Q6_9GAMM|nr:inositol monophosphatase [Acidihalobacter prosperus]OBS10244.1 inositol monophosphatase [Acidihalobacter prosperus]